MFSEDDRKAIKALTRRLKSRPMISKSDFKESEHPRAKDGRFGDKHGEHEPSGRKKTEFSLAAHDMAKKVLSRTNKERNQDIRSLEKQPKNVLRQKLDRIQDQLFDAYEERKKDPDNQKWSDVCDALSRMHSDVNFALTRGK